MISIPLKLIYIQIAFSAMFLSDIAGSKIAGINPLLLFAVYPVAMLELLGISKVYGWIKENRGCLQ